jgi:hypothetical protein
MNEKSIMATMSSDTMLLEVRSQLLELATLEECKLANVETK